MSKLSNWLHQVAGFVTKAIENAPADQHAQLSDATVKLTGAAQAVQDVMPTVAKIAVDGMLAQIGGGQYIPAFNEIVDVLIAELASRKTVAKAA